MAAITNGRGANRHSTSARHILSRNGERPVLYFLTTHLLSLVGASLATAPFSGFIAAFFHRQFPDRHTLLRRFCSCYFLDSGFFGSGCLPSG